MDIRSPRDMDEVLRAADTAESAFGPRDEPGWWRKGFQSLAERFGLGMFLVGEVDGEFVSALLNIPTEVWLEDRLAPLGAVGAVSTHPDHRKRGYAGELMKEIVRRMKAEGTILSALNPFSFAYYRKFGWEYVGTHRVHRFKTDAVGPLPPTDGVTGLAREELPAVSAVSDLAAQRYALTSRWTPESIGVMGMFASAAPFAPAGKASADVLVCREGGEVTGFALATRPEGDDALTRVVWHATTTRLARWKLIAALAERGARTLELNCASDDLFVHEVPEQRDVSTSCGVHYQFRVIDPAKALALLRPEGEGRVRFELSDPVFPEAPLVVTVEWADGTLDARDGGAEGPPVLRADIAAFSMLYANGMRPTEAAAMGRLTGDNEALRLVEMLFPRWTAYRSPVEPG